MFKSLGFGNKKKPEESQETQVDAEKEELKKQIENCEEEKTALKAQLEEEKNRSLTSKGMLKAKEKAGQLKGMFASRMGSSALKKNNPDANEGQGQEGGRKRGKKSKKNRKKKKKSKSKKRRSRRGGANPCPKDICPCPGYFGKDRKMCIEKRAIGRGPWFNYKYGQGKTYDERQASVNADEVLKAKRKEFYEQGKAIREANYEKMKENEEGFNELAKQKGFVGDAAFFAKKLGVKRILGGRRRKKSKKNRKKSKKNRKKSKKNRKKSKRRR